MDQILNLERTTARGAKDTIDHPRNQHDDLANAIAGVASLGLRARGYDIYALADMVPQDNTNDPRQNSIENWRRMRRNFYYESGGVIDIAQRGGRMIDWT